MSVQTIPSIEEMTPLQRAELREELWSVMSRNPEDRSPHAIYYTVEEK